MNDHDDTDVAAFQQLRQADGAILPVAEYQSEFAAVFRRTEGVIWKLERAQYFHEPYDASWNAMMGGRWQRSLELIEQARDTYAREYDGPAEFRRVRIVEAPLTPYMQWELHYLAARALVGERGRVVPAHVVRPLETVQPLPEVVIFSESLAYLVRYDEIGAHIGGRRIVDRDAIRPCIPIMQSLFERGEDMRSYVEREVVPLPPPAIRPSMAS
ncbi:DUF6879 family protein [Thermopolyspora sp. NPDC052614]|uniref:DUF6879 family protein n=1 Tax=Thermopolyspora sp. NPDC052614 TaxID=3155682 RepID=UPI0034405E66